MTIVISLIFEYDHVITNTCWLAVKVNIILISVISYNTSIACWWWKYENLFTQVYQIPRGQFPRWIWYSWVNTFSYFLYPHAMTILLYRMKPRAHKYVKYCGQAYFKSIGTLCRIFKNQMSIASDVFPSKNDSSGGKTREASDGVDYDFYFTEYDFCSVFWFYPMSNQINLCMVINIWGIIQSYILGYTIY